MDQSENRFYREAVPVDGGPAFPQHGWTKDPEVLARMQQNGGMTLRDYFAVHSGIGDEIPVSLAGALMHREPPAYKDDPEANAIYWAEVRARLRYIDADAMLRARGEPCA